MTPARYLRPLLSIVLALSAPFLFAADTAETAAQKAAEQWLAGIDSGKYAASWGEAAKYFQGSITKDKWEAALKSVRDPLGKLVSRKFKEAKALTSVPGGPDGEYVVLQFETSFANKKAAVETVTPMKEKDGQWKVSGYYIK